MSLRRHLLQSTIRLLCAILLCASTAHAQVPRTVNYQGYLTAPNGAVINSASLAITLKLYAAASGGAALYSETQNVAVNNGVFNLLIGAVTPLVLSFDRPYYLGVTVGADAEMTPRQALASAPYALRSTQAESTSLAAGGNVITVIDSSGNTGYDNAITIGSDGLPVISYHALPDADLKVAKCSNPACTSSTIATVDSTGNVGRGSAITFDSDGLPLISYYDFTGNNLKVAKCVDAACGGSATISTVASASNAPATFDRLVSTSIVVAPDGLPTIAYTAGGSTGARVAKCATSNCTGAASVSNLALLAGVTSISIAPDGLPTATFSADWVTAGNARAIKCGAAPCSGAGVGAGLTLTNVVSMVGIDGLLVGAGITADVPGEVRVFQCVDIGCNSLASNNLVFSMGVPAGGSFNGTRNLALGFTFGNDGMPLISFRNFGNGQLYFVRCTDIACATRASAPIVIDANPSTQSAQSMTVGQDGNPVISYIEHNQFPGSTDTAKLKVLKCGNPGCATVRRR